MLQTARDILSAGGWVMWPLLLLSLLSLTLVFERVLFWLGSGSGKGSAAIDAAREHTDPAKLRRTAAEGRDVYSRFLAIALAGAGPVGSGDIHAAAERVRPSIERFSATMSAIITGAPMLGILGTVVGIIDSFQLLGSAGPITDPTQIAGGIAQALYTTAFGLVIALLTLFPHAAFRARTERCLDRLEVLGGMLHTEKKPDT